MRLFFSGTSGMPTRREIGELKIRNRLITYAKRVEHGRLAREWRDLVGSGDGLMIDSGAFSIHTGAKGSENLTHDGYVKFVSDICPEFAIQFDVIGDEDATWRNYVREGRKIETAPAIHYNASAKHIRRVMKCGSSLVCLGGLVQFAARATILKRWLEYVRSFIPEGKRVHVLGITGKILYGFPAYSCDSSSWLSVVRYPEDKGIKRIVQAKLRNQELGTAPRVTNRVQLIKLEADRLRRLVEVSITNYHIKRGYQW